MDAMIVASSGGQLGAALVSGGGRPIVSGTVYGVILNTRSEIAARAEAFTAAPYKAAPRAPVLYIKTPNTLLAPGGAVQVPEGVEALEVNATLAAVFGRAVSCASEADALAGVAGYAAAIDVCVPHAQVYRPAIRQRCRDGFLPLGPLVAPEAVGDLGRLEITVEVDGGEASRFSTADLVRSVPALIAEISGFMTFLPGDALLIGLNPQPAQARAGQSVVAKVGALPPLGCTLQPETALEAAA